MVTLIDFLDNITVYPFAHSVFDPYFLSRDMLFRHSSKYLFPKYLYFV